MRFLLNGQDGDLRIPLGLPKGGSLSFFMVKWRPHASSHRARLALRRTPHGSIKNLSIQSLTAK